jgi:hypothetical protein
MVMLFLAVSACSTSTAGGTPTRALTPTEPAPSSEATAEPATRAASAPTPINLTSKKASVLLFNVRPKPLVHEVIGAEGIAFVEWLDGGTRIVGYNWADHAYEILGVDAGVVDRLYAAFAPQPSADRRSEWAHVLPGGAGILLERDDGAPRIYDIASGAMRPFTGPPGQNVVFSAANDGTRLIFNNIVDGRSRVMISDLDGAHSRVLVANETGTVGLIDEGAPSPDGKYLLLSSSDSSGGHQQSSDIVTDMNGDTLWRTAIPDIQGGTSTDMRWAGSDRLLMTQTKPDGHDGVVVVASTFVSIPSGAETPAPEALALRLVSLSPDGQHAVMMLGDGAAAWERRCALVSIDPRSGSIVELAAANPGPGDYQTVFCANVNWTPDGSQAIVSAGGI